MATYPTSCSLISPLTAVTNCQRPTANCQLQVRYAFLAGLAVSLLLVPLNKLIAGGILTASKGMMAAKVPYSLAWRGTRGWGW